MGQVIVLAVIVVILLAVIFRSGRKSASFVKHTSRGAFMRDLNKKGEEKLGETGTKD
jgi:hypothetical protein